MHTAFDVLFLSGYVCGVGAEPVKAALDRVLVS
jgi:hypothetical protein